jgi:hypothetical protein
MDQYDIVIVQMMAMIASNTNEMFNSHEMERRRGGGSQFVDSIVGVWHFWVLCKSHWHYLRL